MFRKGFLFFLIIILAAVQISFLPHFFYGSISPDIVLLIIIIWSAKNGFEKTWLWAIVSGLALDVLLFNAPGANALSFLLAAYLSGFLAKRYLVSQKALAFLTTLGFAVIGTVGNYLILSAFIIFPIYFLKSSPFHFATGFFFANLGLKILYNLILFPIAYWFARKTEYFLRPVSDKIYLK